MQTPAGFRRKADGKFAPVSWMDAIFTPSLPYRYLHMVTAAYLAGTFVVIGVCGFYLWRRRHQEFAGAGLSVALWIVLVLVPLQGVLGDLHGRNSSQYQPIKVAAMEGDWQTRPGQHLVLFAWPDVANERNDYELAVPGLGSLILTHDWNGQIVDLGSKLVGMRDLLRATLGARIELQVSAKSGLWRALVDPTQIELVVLNLAINARDAMLGQGSLSVETFNTVIDVDSLRPEDPTPATT
jgi:cytochrome bd-type quinol oxidase subunit 1